MSLSTYPLQYVGLGSAAFQSYTTDTFTVTATGFSGTAPSGTVRWVQIGTQMTVHLPNLTGTSNATTFTLTGIPAALDPVSNVIVAVYTQDAFLFGPGGLSISAGGTWSVYYGKAANGLDWTASGTKRLPGAAITYLVP